ERHRRIPGAASPERVRHEAALEQGILKEAPPAALERGLVARLGGRAETSELAREIRGKPLGLGRWRERLALGCVRTRRQGKQQDDDGTHEFPLDPYRAASAICCAGFM